MPSPAGPPKTPIFWKSGSSTAIGFWHIGDGIGIYLVPKKCKKWRQIRKNLQKVEKVTEGINLFYSYFFIKNTPKTLFLGSLGNLLFLSLFSLGPFLAFFGIFRAFYKFLKLLIKIFLNSVKNNFNFVEIFSSFFCDFLSFFEVLFLRFFETEFLWKIQSIF